MEFNELGIESKPDWNRIRHLMKVGIFAGIIVLAGDAILGWGICDESLNGFDLYFSRYLTVSDLRIVLSAILGLIGIPLEVLSYFGIYRLIVPYSKKDAHAYRSGLLGMLTFGALTHVLCCMIVYLGKMLYRLDPENAASAIIRSASSFLLPAAILFFIFYILASVVQFKSFRKGHTPYPKRCCIFNPLSGLIIAIPLKAIGDYALTNALVTGWISIGSLFMLTGLLIMSRSAEGKESRYE
jgi:hypothetical protein